MNIDSDLKKLLDHAQTLVTDSMIPTRLNSHEVVGAPEEESRIVSSNAIHKTSIMDQVFVETRQNAWGRRGASHPWMVLSGNVGSGKTIAAIWALARGIPYTETGRRCFVESADLLPLNPRFGPHLAQLQKYESARFLIVDDLGQLDTVEGAICEPVQRVLLKRLNRKLPTCVTTNLTPSQLFSAFGQRARERFEDRLRQVWRPLFTTEESFR